MGLRTVGIATLVVGYAIWRVWPGEPASVPTVVAHAREGRAPATAAQQLRAAAIDVEIPDLEDDAEEAEAEQPALDGDGLTDEERWESQVVELEERLEASRRGALHGVVRDAENADRLAGVTVIATSPSVQGAQAAITDEQGYYAIAELPPGDYQVTFYYLDVTVERSGVQVSSRVATPVMQTLQQDIHPIRPFVLTLDESVDISLDNLPSTVSFTGIESLQNTYVVDSVDVTGLTLGDDE